MTKKLLLKFEADWCGPCQQIKPVVAAIQEQFADQLAVNTIDVDSADHGLLLQKYNIRSVPTLVLLNGNDVLVQQSGSVNYQQLRDLIAPHMKSA